MGEVGGNGSVVWQNLHRNGSGKKFKCKDKNGKLNHDELGLNSSQLEVWGRDEIAVAQIGTTPVGDIEPGLIQRPGHFLVRLRFDGSEANAIEAWFNATTSTPASAKMSRDGDTVILAFLVKAIERKDPGTGPYEDLPMEIRYDW